MCVRVPVRNNNIITGKAIWAQFRQTISHCINTISSKVWFNKFDDILYFSLLLTLYYYVIELEPAPLNACQSYIVLSVVCVALLSGFAPFQFVFALHSTLWGVTKQNTFFIIIPSSLCSTVKLRKMRQKEEEMKKEREKLLAGITAPLRENDSLKPWSRFLVCFAYSICGCGHKSTEKSFFKKLNTKLTYFWSI